MDTCTWQDIESAAVNTSTIALHPRAEIADPRLMLGKLAERIAQRAGYPQADKECQSIARKMFAEIGDVEKLLAAYDRLEKSRDGQETFFVRIAREQSAGWQMRQILAEVKRGAPKPRSWMDGFEHCVNR